MYCRRRKRRKEKKKKMKKKKKEERERRRRRRKEKKKSAEGERASRMYVCMCLLCVRGGYIFFLVSFMSFYSSDIGNELSGFEQ